MGTGTTASPTSSAVGSAAGGTPEPGAKAAIELLRPVVGSDAIITDPAELATYECDGLTNFRAVPPWRCWWQAATKSRPWWGYALVSTSLSSRGARVPACRVGRSRTPRAPSWSRPACAPSFR